LDLRQAVCKKNNQAQLTVLAVDEPKKLSVENSMDLSWASDECKQPRVELMHRMHCVLLRRAFQVPLALSTWVELKKQNDYQKRDESENADF
jgi:hypothetical protein